jgi:biopolymer transport protein ExbD
MKLRKREEPLADIDMTPMIDMVFLLLVFFMCAATMSKVDFTPEIELPIAPDAQVPEDLRDRGTVNILPEGFQVSPGVVVTEERPFLVSGRMVDREELTDYITEMRQGRTDMQVYMRIDRRTEFARVKQAIRACAEAGVFDIIFGSYQSAGGGGGL